jgi:aminoglycoside phosphotransferase (APT) family kinase protein
MLDWQEQTLNKRGIPIDDVLAALLRWLRHRVPQTPGRVSILHGDATFANIMVNHGTVSAVVDWEMAHLGDAAEELAYLRPSVEPVVPWERFLEWYESAGGTRPDPDSLRFHTVLSHVWRHIGTLWMRQNFEVNQRHPAAIAGYVNGPRYLQMAVESALLPEQEQHHGTEV